MRTAATSSGVPTTSPVLCGPPIPFPPLNTASDAPIPVSSVRLERGGNCAAASTITGTPHAPAPRVTSASCSLLWLPRKNTTAAVRVPMAPTNSPVLAAALVPTRTSLPPHASMPWWM